jgi:hypothetical protein
MEYQEKQRFNQWWMILLMGGVSAMVYYGSVSQWITGIPFGDKPLSDMGLLFPVVLITVVNLGLFTGGLTTRVDENGKNRALNVSGSFGLQLVMKDGAKMLIGTQKPQELEDFLKSLPVANEILKV